MDPNRGGATNRGLAWAFKLLPFIRLLRFYPQQPNLSSRIDARNFKEMCIIKQIFYCRKVFIHPVRFTTYLNQRQGSVQQASATICEWYTTSRGPDSGGIILEVCVGRVIYKFRQMRANLALGTPLGLVVINCTPFSP